MSSLSLTIWWMLAAAAAVGQEPALRITHGPILGRPESTAMGVWARTSRPGAFRVRYGLAPGELDRVSEAVETRIDRDNTGWVRLTGLRPGTRYFYRVMAGEDDRPGPGGSFRTLPDPTEYRHPELNPRGLFNIRFEFGCGNNQAPSQGCGPDLPAFRTMLERHRDEVQLAILNGDWLYEERREFPVEEWVRQVGLGEGEMPEVVRIAPTIAGVWENYKLYLERGSNLAAWHREIPSYFTFDDHEILNDIWGAGTAGLRDRRAVFRDIGVQAWYDYLGWSNPVEFTQRIYFGEARLEAGSDILHDPRAAFDRLELAQAANLNVHWGGPTAGVNDNALDGVGGDPNAGVYEIVEVLGRDRLRIHPAARSAGAAAYSIGRRNYCRFRAGNCDFFLLDTRSHREMHDIERPAKPGLTMLGRRQREWLLAEMERSDADFLFVVSSVNLMVPHVGGGAIRPGGKDEAWTVFLDERERLIDFWDGLGRPVFVLTGDLHNSFAVKITDRVWEFASGPHNSQNHIAADEGGRPASGPFDSRGRRCEIRWSSWYRDDIPRSRLCNPLYCVVQVNNVFRNSIREGEERWVAFPRPQAVFRFHDGRTGELLYAEAVAATR